MSPQRRRDVIYSKPAPGKASVSAPNLKNRVPIDRDEMRTFFSDLGEKAKRTLNILDAMGQGVRIDIRNASPEVRAIVRHIDPSSLGNYITWETYKVAADRVHAACFPDMDSYLRSMTADPIANSEILKTLFEEQAMVLKNGPTYQIPSKDIGE